jgi:hypothetical protein
VRFEVFTAVEFQIDVFWVLTPCGVMVGYQRFGDREVGCSMDLRNAGIQQTYMALQPRVPRLEPFLTGLYLTHKKKKKKQLI